MGQIPVQDDEAQADGGEDEAGDDLSGFVDHHRSEAARRGQFAFEEIGFERFPADVGQRRQLVYRLSGQFGHEEGAQPGPEAIRQKGETPGDGIGDVPRTGQAQDEREVPLQNGEMAQHFAQADFADQVAQEKQPQSGHDEPENLHHRSSMDGEEAGAESSVGSVAGCPPCCRIRCPCSILCWEINTPTAIRCRPMTRNQ